MTSGFPLDDVLTIANLHLFYSATPYPPRKEDLPIVLAKHRETTIEFKLSSFPLTRKERLYKQISRLTTNRDPRNGYRQETYNSTTGEDSGKGSPTVFATDSQETRQQRAAIGTILRSCGITGPGDWIMTMHVSGHLYSTGSYSRSIRGSGATVLCAGSHMEQGQMVEKLIEYRVNGIAGDTGQIVQLSRLLYTSEMMTPAQRSVLNSVFPNKSVSSVIGSAEAGPWAVSPAKLMQARKAGHYVDFLYDQRLICLKVFPFTIKDSKYPYIEHVRPLPDGEKGLLVQTSLQRMRHPLIRYVCDEVCSLHPLPASIKVEISPEGACHYKVARIYGRDNRISFDWYEEYFEFPVIQEAIRNEEWGILQYQIIRRYEDQDTLGIVLELRVLRHNEPGTISEEELTRELRKLFWVFENKEELFDLRYPSDYAGFIRSTTGQKVINFIDRIKANL